jgi:hypothetical protein
MIEVGDAIMENGDTGKLEKLLEAAHGSLEDDQNVCFEEGWIFVKKEGHKGDKRGEFCREKLGYAGDLPLHLRRS